MATGDRQPAPEESYAHTHSAPGGVLGALLLCAVFLGILSILAGGVAFALLGGISESAMARDQLLPTRFHNQEWYWLLLLSHGGVALALVTGLILGLILHRSRKRSTSTPEERS